MIVALLILPALILGAAGCSRSSGEPSSAGSAAAALSSNNASATAAACSRAEIAASIGNFFDRWNHRAATPLGQLFADNAVLDMATKHQNTLKDQAWASTGGRAEIVTFAKRQWSLGEELSHRGMTIYVGNQAGDGGEVSNVIATFRDGTTQPMDEAKFIYDCTSHTFTHVEIVSASAAARA